MFAGDTGSGNPCCVVCGGREGGSWGHKCDPKKIARFEAAAKAADTRRENGTQNRNYSTRLSAGFGLLAMAGDR